MKHYGFQTIILGDNHGNHIFDPSSGQSYQETKSNNTHLSMYEKERKNHRTWTPKPEYAPLVE